AGAPRGGTGNPPRSVFQQGSGIMAGLMAIEKIIPVYSFHDEYSRINNSDFSQWQPLPLSEKRPLSNGAMELPFIRMEILLGIDRLRIPAQAATRIRFIPPPDSDSSRHPIPIDSAMGIRSIPPPPGRG
ncbi:MAG: hypothetical protein KKF02_13780, partial [Proteobacteria bacterium]|nr:hypothetical protein [Pseudomonadota bacterium]